MWYTKERILEAATPGLDKREQSLRVISIKFLLVIWMLCKRNDHENLLDIL